MKSTLLPAALFCAALVAAPAVLPAESVDEAVIHVKVRAVLLEHYGSDALGIGIQVVGGNVVLSGSVDKPLTQELARQAALSVKGVSNVESRIQLAGSPVSKAKTTSDRATTKLKNALLETKVKARLFDQVGGNALKIEVEASGGSVSLRGVVPSASIRKTAIDTAKATGGVRRVQNLLTIG